jgi:DNA topoisomerase I
MVTASARVQRPAGGRERRGRAAAIVESPVESAWAAGLRYVSDRMPGIRRTRKGKHFAYRAPDGTPIRNKQELARITSLAIPPAWTDVWICPNPRGHLQATGKDARGRKVYRYHPRWRAVRDETKYHRMLAFGEALPAIRARVADDLAVSGPARARVLAAVVHLLDETAIRVGNEEYARQNASFGLTTLRNDHVDVEGSTIRFQFRGKSGKDHEVEISDRRVARLLRKLQDLPGQHLFGYRDEHGNVRAVESADVNDYLREISGQDFTAKDFRTWEGTVIVARELRAAGEAETKAEAKQRVADAIKAASARLGNTPAICKTSYVHPAVLDGYETGRLLRVQPNGRPLPEHLDADEAALLAFLSEAASQQPSDVRAS